MTWGLETNIKGPAGPPSTVPGPAGPPGIQGIQGPPGPTGPGGTATALMSDTPPVGAQVGSLWVETDTGYLYFYYNDGTSSQWVMVSPGSGGISQADADLRYVRYGGAQGLTAAQATQARQNVYAAPLDALAYNGMQINGSMEVSQESGSTSVTGIVNNTRNIVDGWMIQSIGVGSVTGAPITSVPPPGGTTSLQLFVNTANGSPAAGDLLRIIQRIEGYRVSRMGWGGSNPQPMTIGFWVWTTIPGAYSGAVINAAGNRSYAFLFTVSAASTWQYVTQTIPGDTTGVWQQSNLTGLELSITLMAGTTYKTAAGAWTAGAFFGATGMINGAAANNFLISSVVVLPGIEAPAAARSPLIMRPYDQELLTCKRYWQKSYIGSVAPGTAVGASNGQMGFTGTSGAFFQSHEFPIVMRSTPTMKSYDNAGNVGYTSLYTTAWSNVLPLTFPVVSEKTFICNANYASATVINFDWTADARL